MTMIGVLAEAEIGDSHHRGHRIAQRPHGPLHDSIVAPARTPHRILPVRNPEEDHPPDPEVGDLSNLLHEHVDGVLIDPRHRGDRAPNPFASHDEERLDQIVDGDRRLGHEPTEGSTAAQSTQSVDGKGHGATG